VRGLEQPAQAGVRSTEALAQCEKHRPEAQAQGHAQKKIYISSFK